MPWWYVLVGVLLAIALGWLVLDWLLGEADRATGIDTRAPRSGSTRSAPA